MLNRFGIPTLALLSFVLWSWSGWVGAQPTKGKTYSEAVPVSSDRMVPLPPGEWKVLHVAEGDPTKRLFSSAQMVVLKNQRPDSRVPLIFIRTVDRATKWQPTGCMEGRNTQAFMVSLHGTARTQSVSKCSEVLDLGLFGGWVNARLKDPDSSTWWKPALPALTEVDDLWDRQMVVSYVEATEFNGAGISIQAFVTPPPRVKGVSFRASYVAGDRNKNHEILEEWLAAYVQATQQSFLDKRRARIGDLNFQSAAQAPRKAFVVGIDNYAQLPKLNTSTADAQAVARALEATGFKVSLLTNAAEKPLKEAWSRFAQELAEGDDVVFYFAGHGVQLAGGGNLLLPTDTAKDSEEQVRKAALPLQKVMEDLEDKKSKFSLVVVDACHLNPFKKIGVNLGDRGLAPAQAAKGQLVMFAADWGQESLDKLGPSDPDRNGLLARVWVKELQKPGVPVDRTMRSVRNEVMRLAKSVGAEQAPALFDQTVGEFYFRP